MCILLFLSVFRLVAQQDFSFRLRYLTTEEGLSQNTVDDILRDSQGFMWFATWNGLCRFDGYDFQVFKAEGQQGLPGNFVQRVCEGPVGRIWIGTSQGLGAYDIGAARFVPMDWAGPALRQANVSALAVDDRGNVWVGTVDQGIFCLTPASKPGASYTVTHFPQTNNPVYSLLARPGGGCWIGTRKGIWGAMPGDEPRLATEWVLPASPVREVRSLWQDTDGHFWAGTDFGLFRFSRPGAAPEVFMHNPDDPRSLVHNTVSAICRDIKGRLLIGTLGGLCTFTPGQGFKTLHGSLAAKTQLNNAFVNSLLCDAFGNVWVGTEKGGVNTYNVFQKKFHQLTHEQGNPNSLRTKTVNSVFAEEKYLWIGTAGGGLHRVERATGAIAYSAHDPHLPSSLSSDFVTAIHRESKGELWVATWGGGLNRMRGDNFRSFERIMISPSGSGSDFVSSIWEDGKGYLLAGTSAGLVQIDVQTDQVRPVRLGRYSNPESSQIGCLLRDRDGYYWVGTRRGLFRFPATSLAQVQQGETPPGLEFFQADPSRHISLPGDYIISLHQDQSGSIWLGTFGDGLVKVRINEGKVMGFESFNQSQGLCNNTVYSIEEDEEGALWLTTDNGLSRFHPAEKQFRNYFKSDGLADNQFYWSASCKDTQGNLYFGGVNGLTFFSPKEIQPYQHAPEVVFSDFKVFNQSLKVGETRHGLVALRQAIALADRVELSYKDNVFAIEFTAQNYHLPERLTYFYQMEGVDQNWVQVSSDRRFAGYTNLGGGAYTFRVKAVNEDGITSGEVATLTVVIRPPFWATAWFIGLMLVLAFATVMAYIHLRTRYLQGQKRKLEQEVERRTRKIEEQKAELEEQKLSLIELNEKVKMVNQLRLRFFTNISHEFRTPLTLIIDPIESLLEAHPADSPTGKTLRMMYRNGQRLLHLIHQLMSFRRLESGKLRVRAVEKDLPAFVQEVFASFEELARHQRMHYTFRQEGQSQGPTWFDPEKLEHVLYNLLANAFKYTPKEGEISLNLRFGQDAGGAPVAEIRVKDSGIGIPPDQQDRIFDHFYQVETPENRHLHGSGVGLALTKELVMSMHGQVRVESGGGPGSTFVVTLPYMESSFGKNEREAEPGPYHSNLSTQVELTREELQQLDPPLVVRAEPGRRDLPLLLIAEDNYDLRAFLKESLSPQYRILEADNGKDALELARKYTPHLIISDIMMPVMDGIELCSHLKSHIQTSHIPVILLTARNLVEHWVEGLETGADDYIAKPFNLRILQARIENLISSRHQLKLLFTKDVRPHAGEVATNSLDQQFLQRVYDLLDQQDMEAEFSHDQLAEAMCVSRSLLYKKIKALTGMTVTEFSNSHRLRQAARLLNEGEIPISEVAYRCGFQDPKYFSRIFRKYYGMTPSEYAQRELKNVV
jgi:signal transduction histidine kinase/ligand-binding sensor domain-containing protein/DNA-binding response OmpR family regulator